MLYATVSQPQPWFLILIGTLWSCLVLNTDALQIFSKGHPLYMGLVGNLKSTSCFPEKALISETYMYPQLSNPKSPKFQNHTYMCPAKSGWRALGMRASQSSAIGRGQVFNEGYCPRATPKFKKISQYKMSLRHYMLHWTILWKYSCLTAGSGQESLGNGKTSHLLSSFTW